MGLSKSLPGLGLEQQQSHESNMMELQAAPTVAKKCESRRSLPAANPTVGLPQAMRQNYQSQVGTSAKGRSIASKTVHLKRGRAARHQEERSQRWQLPKTSAMSTVSLPLQGKAGLATDRAPAAPTECSD